MLPEHWMLYHFSVLVFVEQINWIEWVNTHRQRLNWYACIDIWKLWTSSPDSIQYLQTERITFSSLPCLWGRIIQRIQQSTNLTLESDIWKDTFNYRESDSLICEFNFCLSMQLSVSTESILWSFQESSE